MRKTIRIVQVTLHTIAAIFVATSTAISAQYGLRPELKSDTVHFESDARLEFIEGSTTEITGSFEFDPDHVNQVTGVVRCDLRTLQTGIETRDGHMRDRHLHTDKFPDAFFELTSQTGLPEVLDSNKEYSCEAAGKFYIHGVAREIKPKLLVERRTLDGEEILKVKATFAIRLDDFEIPRPKALLFKLAEVILVDVSFVAHRNVKSDNIVLPEWKLLH